MASTASPYGLRPSKKLGGQPYNHGMNLYKIASAYGTAIFQGDLVKMLTDGTIAKATNTTDAPTNGFLGVFMGVSYTDSNMGFIHKNNWVASTVATDALAYVVDDPDVLFEIQADSTLDATALGGKAALVQTAGSAVTGVSAVALQASSVNTTNTLPLAIVDYVNRPGVSALGDAYTDLLVRINLHAHASTTGI